MNSTDQASLLAFGAHPDDIEFGCGAVVALETRAGRNAHFVICSKGEAGTSGTPEQRADESREAARILGASIEFLELDGDAHLEIKNAHTMKLAAVIRRIRPAIVLAPTCEQNQHPDHWRLGRIVRDAARLARYGGLKEMDGLETHSIESLFYYAITPEGEARDIAPVFIDVSDPELITTWTNAMSAHKSQSATRDYIALQLTRARLLGARAAVAYAIALYPNDPIVFESLYQAGKGARNF